MHILILDTSGSFSTVIVARNQKILGTSSLRARPASHLHEQIRTLLTHLDTPLSAVNQIGVTVGPGSWTGLNIGVTAAKTLAQVLDISLVCIPTLDALVATRSWDRGDMCAFLHAGRRRIYVSWYPTDNAGYPDLTNVRTDIVPFETWKQQLLLASGRPLILEYGNVYCSSLPYPFLESQDMLQPESTMRAFYAHATSALQNEDILPLSPAYWQASLAERDTVDRQPM